MTGSEPVILATIVASISSLAAQALARLRWRCVPDDSGNVRCLSGCTDAPLGNQDEHQLDIQEIELGGKRALLVSAKSE